MALLLSLRGLGGLGAGLLLLMGCEVDLSDGNARWPAELERGLSYAGWTPSGYGSAESDESLAELARTGATDVAIVATAYMSSETESVVGRYPNRTPTVESLRAAMRRARELGLRVAFKPHVDVLGGAYRGTIAPDDPELWFETYRAVLLPWAELAEEQRCASFWIGTELDSMTVHQEQWAALIEATRERYTGPIVYAANWTDLESEDTLELARRVDLLGIDAYFPLSDWPDPSVADMVMGWQPWLELIEAVSRETDRPILITELGCMSRRGAPMSPWDYEGDQPVDVDVQARYYEAALRALPTTDVVRGVYFWAWGVGLAGPGDGSHSPRGKPAATVLRRFWREVP